MKDHEEDTRAEGEGQGPAMGKAIPAWVACAMQQRFCNR